MKTNPFIFIGVKAVHARARRAIRAGMRQWTRRTCVRFRRRRRERAYVRFVRGSG